MRHPAQNNRFTTARHAAEAVCFYAVVAMVAVAVGFVSAVLVLTAPKRTALLNASLPAVAWEFSR